MKAMTTRDEFRERWEANQPAHKDEFMATFWGYAMPFADDHGWIPPWAVGMLYVWSIPEGGLSWWNICRDFGQWLTNQTNRGELVAALVAATDLAPDLSRGDAFVEALGVTGWPRGARLAALFREDRANPPRRVTEWLIAESATKDRLERR